MTSRNTAGRRTRDLWPTIGQLALLAACVGCAHVLALKTSPEDAAQFATVEDFVADDFSVGMESLSDVFPNGKPNYVIAHGFVRYEQTSCQGDLSRLEKPSADLKTFCQTKGGKLTLTRTDPGTALAEAGEVGWYACERGRSSIFRACVRVEAVTPGGSDCSTFRFLIQGATVTESQDIDPGTLCKKPAP